MSRRPRRNHTPAFKARCACCHQGRSMTAQLGEQFDVPTDQITLWKVQLEEEAPDVFGPGGGKRGAQQVIDVLQAQWEAQEVGRTRTEREDSFILVAGRGRCA